MLLPKAVTTILEHKKMYESRWVVKNMSKVRKKIIIQKDVCEKPYN